MELYPAQINFLPEDEKQQVIRDLKTKAENIEETSRSLLETAKKLERVWRKCKIACFGRLETDVPSMSVIVIAGGAALNPSLPTGFSIGIAGAISNSGTAIVDSHANSAEMKKAEKQLAKIRESINEVHTIVQKVLMAK